MTDYYGHPTCCFASPFLEIEVLAEAGPRLVRLRRPGRQENLLAETPDLGWQTPFGDFHMFGGHRLWFSPETELTSIPDNDGLEIHDLPDGLRLIGAVQTQTGLRKEIILHLSPDRAEMVLEHIIRNEGTQTVRGAAWAITQLPVGGVAYLPLRAPNTGLQPDRNLVFWPYASVSDPRLHLEDDAVWVEALLDEHPFKIGAACPAGWVSYTCAGVTLTKRFDPQPGLPHPDMGCSAEIYCNHRFLELESLAALVDLPPGAETRHMEMWEIH